MFTEHFSYTVRLYGCDASSPWQGFCICNTEQCL